VGPEDLMDLAEAEKLTPEHELRAFWWDACDGGPTPDGFTDRMSTAGLIDLRPVNSDDLDDAFADEHGIVPGGEVWDLTEAGRRALEKTND